MSLIHEALKKVERQRKQGELPTLDSPHFQRPRRRRWPWLVLAAGALLLAGAWIWRGPLAQNIRTVAGAPSAELDAQAAADPGAEVLPTNQGLAVVRTRDNAPTAKPESRSIPERKAATSRPDVAQTRGTQPREPEGTLATATGTPELKPPAATPRAPSAVVSDSATTRQEEKLPPMYWELPYASRHDVADMVITMHMYADRPADRFVIIDGVRQVEGDTLPNGLILKSINPDDITLDKDGLDFRVSRRGTN